MPLSFAKRISEALGSEFEAFTKCLSGTAPVSIRKHPIKFPICHELGEDEVIPWCGLGVYLNERPRFHMDPLWHAGAYYVQEASSMYLEQAVRLLDLPEEAVVLDACAAPGGKSTHLLSLLGPDALLVSNEVIPKRNHILQENLEKWGYANVVISQNRTSSFGALPNFFDLIVVDAPCSGEGLFRKDPKAVMEWSDAHVEACSRRQQVILEDLTPGVRPGGYLVYSTCTYSKVENEDRIKILLDSGQWEQIELPTAPFKGLQRGARDIGVRFYPHRIRGEGFFMACLRRKGLQAVNVRPVRKIKGNCPKELDAWLDTEGLHYSEWKGQGSVFPSLHLRSFDILQKALHITKTGTGTGQFIHGNLKPAHSLALSIHTSPDIPFISLTLEDSVKYLKKEMIPYRQDNTAGWNLVQYEGVNLGWSKVLDRRINNYYPKSLSIRP